MPSPAVALGTGTLASGFLGSRSADKATDAQTAASQASIAENRAARESYERRTEPFRQVGLSAATPILQMLGIQPPQELIDSINGSYEQPQTVIPPRPTSGLKAMMDWKRKYGSDAAQERLNQENAQSQQQTPAPPASEPPTKYGDFLRQRGFDEIQESAAAQGRLRSGGTLQDLTEFNTNLAGQLENQRFNQLFNLLGLGSNTASGQGTAAMNTASNISNLNTGAGQAMAANALQQGQIQQQAVGDLAQVIGYGMNQPQAFTPSTLPTLELTAGF